MARHATIDDQELVNKLTGVFRDVGYYGASLSALSEATGLKKASLYHRFPEGKEQMAREVLAAAETWLSEHILSVLKNDTPPEHRIRGMVEKLDEFYSGGRQACLLNMLSSTQIHQGPFRKLIKRVFLAWKKGLQTVLIEAGFDKEIARIRAERALTLIQGSLVLSRGMGTNKPFKETLSRLPEELLGK